MNYRTQKKFVRRYHDALTAAAILIPMLLWWFASNGFPTLFGFVLGSFDWKNISKAPTFAGIQNFITFFTSKTYLLDLWRTIWLGGVCTLITVVTGFAVALLMNLPLKAKGIYRTIWYVPAVTSPIAVTQIIGILLNPIDGITYDLLNKIGFKTSIWSESVFWSLFFIIVYSAWKGIGGAAIIWLAGLQSIDQGLYEAAETDGAGKLAKFWNITVPGLRPIATFIVITGIIGSLQIYEPIAFITNGGPSEQTMVIPLRIIKDGFFNFNFGMAGASGLVLAVIAFILSLSYYRYSQRED